MDVCVGRTLYGTPIARRFKYSVQSLSLEAGIHRQTLCKVLVDRGLIDASDAGKPNSVLLVDAEEGRRVADMLRNSVPQQQLPALMNTTLPVVTNLIELDLLTQLHRKSGRTKRAKCGFDRRQVDELLDRLHDLAPEMPDLPGNWVTLTQCTKRARVPMQYVLQLIFEGRVSGIGRSSGELGFNAIRIDLDEVRGMKL